jgi:hypothetical protein
MGTDSVMHSLFYCQFARAVWLASPLRIHSDSLPSDFVQVFILFKSRLNVSTFKLFLNTLWALWKVRCSFLYEGKNASPMSVLRMVSEYTNCGLSLPSKCIPVTQRVVSVSWDSNDYCCFVDGSFTDTKGGHGGAAAILKQSEQLISYNVVYFQASSPLHTEVQAISFAVQEIKSRRMDRV